MTSAAPVLSPEDDLPLPCPGCGYDLRGNVGGICPECGQKADPQVFSGEALIPWQYRDELGRTRALFRTAAKAMLHPGAFARQAGRDVKFPDARRFQLLCVVVAFAGLLLPVTGGMVALVRFSPIGQGNSLLPKSIGAALADGGIVMAAVVGLFLWLWLASGVPSYFFHPRRLDRRLQDRAIALSYYAASPLLLVPLLPLTLALGIGVYVLWNEPPLLVEGAYLLVVGVIWLLILVELLVLPVVFLAAGLEASILRLVACGLTMAIAWPVLFALLVLGLPALVIYVQVAWHLLT